MSIFIVYPLTIVYTTVSTFRSRVYLALMTLKILSFAGRSDEINNCAYTLSYTSSRDWLKLRKVIRSLGRAAPLILTGLTFSAPLKHIHAAGVWRFVLQEIRKHTKLFSFDYYRLVFNPKSLPFNRPTRFREVFFMNKIFPQRKIHHRLLLR